MRVFVTGGTGLIGRRLVRRLIDRGDQPVVLSRNQGAAWRLPDLRGAEVVPGDPGVSADWAQYLDGCDAVVNLAGHNLFANRWNAEVKRKIRDSRVQGTDHVVAAIRQAAKRPGVLVNASAIGYYGFRGDEELTEESPSGTDFMARTCREWEEAAHQAEEIGTRVAILRTGVVLAKGEGALGAMTPIFKWVPGGAAPIGGGGSPLKPGTGRQWLSWVHREDAVGIFLLALDRHDARGPINGTAPHPERNVEFSRALARVLRRPLLPIGPPDVVLRVALGEVAQIITEGQRVLPKKAEALGYAFRFPDLPEALRDLFAKAPAPAAKVEVPAGVGH